MRYFSNGGQSRTLRNYQRKYFISSFHTLANDLARPLPRLLMEVTRFLLELLRRALSENPKPSGCRKITGSKSDWRIRVGDYRVIYEVDEQEKAVKVMRIRHRRDAYR